MAIRRMASFLLILLSVLTATKKKTAEIARKIRAIAKGEKSIFTMG